MAEDWILCISIREHDEHGDAATVEFLQLTVEAFHGAFVDHVRPSVELVHDGVFRIVRPQMTDTQIRVDVLRAQIRSVLHIDDAADAFDLFRTEQRLLIALVTSIDFHDVERICHRTVL